MYRYLVDKIKFYTGKALTSDSYDMLITYKDFDRLDARGMRHYELDILDTLTGNIITVSQSNIRKYVKDMYIVEFLDKYIIHKQNKEHLNILSSLNFVEENENIDWNSRGVTNVNYLKIRNKTSRCLLASHKLFGDIDNGKYLEGFIYDDILNWLLDNGVYNVNYTIIDDFLVIPVYHRVVFSSYCFKCDDILSLKKYLFMGRN